MTKPKKIMDIPDISFNTISGTAIKVDIYNIKHSPVHCHNNFITLVFCLKGQINILSNQDILTLKCGEIYCIGLNDLHCIFSDTDNITAMVYLDIHKISLPLDTIQCSCFVIENDSFDSFRSKPLREIKQCLLAIIYSYAQSGTVKAATANHLTDKIIELLMKYFDWNSGFDLSRNINCELRQRLRSVVKYCGINYMHKLTIPQLAATLHVNENYLSQFMKKSGYGSFSAMISYFRCFYAQFLLLSSDLSVIQIADKVGFSDVKYFYKHFNRIWHKTPTEFRQWFKNYIKTENAIHYYSSKNNDELLNIIKDYIVEDFLHAITIE